MIQEKDIPQIVKVISLLKENSDGKKFTSYFSYGKKDSVYTVDFFNYEQVLERISIREDSVDGVLASLQSRIEQATTDLGIEKNSGYIDRDKKALEGIFDKVRRLNSCDNVKTLSFSFGTNEEEFLFRIAWDYCKDGCKRYFCINGNTPQNTLEEFKSSYGTLPIEKKKLDKLKVLCQEKGQEGVKFVVSFYKKFRKEKSSFGAIYKAKKLIGKNFLDKLGD